MILRLVSIKVVCTKLSFFVVAVAALAAARARSISFSVSTFCLLSSSNPVEVGERELSAAIARAIAE